jgi:hypothetical protein
LPRFEPVSAAIDVTGLAADGREGREAAEASDRDEALHFGHQVN